MALDPRTTLTAAACVTGITTLLLVLFRRTRRTYPGFGSWAGASGLVALGFALLAGRGVIPDLLSIVVANTSVATASVLRLSGTREFLQQSPMRRSWWVLPPLAGVALLLLTYGVDAYAGRTVIVLAAIAAPAAATGLSFLRAGRPDDPLLHRETGSLFLVLVAVMVLRMVSAPVLPTSLLATSAAQTTFLFAAALLESSWNVLFLMLNSSRLEEELRRALEEVRTLSGLLPICSWCKKIRDDRGYWLQLERYVTDHSEARFTHGICPDCATRMRADAVYTCAGSSDAGPTGVRR